MQKRFLVPVVVVALLLVATGAVAGFLIGSDDNGGSGEAATSASAAKAYIGLSVSSTGRELRVAAVEASGPAAAAGLQSGDILRSIDGQVVRTPEQLKATVEAKKPGDRVSVTYERGDKELQAQVRLGETPVNAQIEAPGPAPLPNQPGQPQDGLQNRGRLGALVAPITPALKQRFNLSRDGGIVVADVAPGTPGAAAGLQAGDVIVSFAGRSVTNAQDLQQAVQAAQPNQALEVRVVRGAQEMTLTATLPPVPTIAGIENLPPALRERLQQALQSGNLTPQQVEQLQRLYANATDNVRTGTVKSVNPSTLVLSQFAGGDVSVTLTPQTEVHRRRDRIQPADLKANETVIVFSRDGGKTAFGIISIGMVALP